MQLVSQQNLRDKLQEKLPCVMHQSNSAVPTPPPPPRPGQPRGICSRCQSRRRGIRNFITAPGGAFAYPGAIPWRLIHVASKPCVQVMEAFADQDVNYVADWLVHQGLEKLVDVFKGDRFLKVTCFFISCIVKRQQLVLHHITYRDRKQSTR